MKQVPIPQDDLVEALVRDAGNIEDYQVLSGWIGKSTRKGHVRLYYQLDMSAYVEFKEEDVVYHKAFQTSSTSLGCTALWLLADAKIIGTEQADEASSESNFLEGEFMSYMSSLEQETAYPTGGLSSTAMAAGKSKIWPKRCGLSQKPTTRSPRLCCCPISLSSVSLTSK